MLHQIKRGDLFKELMEYGKQNRNTLNFYEPYGNPGEENIYICVNFVCLYIYTIPGPTLG